MIKKKLLYLYRGDIVIARSPADPYQFICKRLIAMEGDSVIDDNSERQYVNILQYFNFNLHKYNQI